MAFGYKQQGDRDFSSFRLSKCGEDIPDSDFTPTAWAGSTDFIATPEGNWFFINQPWLAPTTGDVSIELWVKRLYPDSISNWQSDAGGTIGYGHFGVSRSGGVPSTSVSAAGVRFFGFAFLGSTARAFWTTPNVAAVVTLTLPMGWHHVAINFDRDGNMEAFVDGISQGTSSIAADSAVDWIGSAQNNARLCYMDPSAAAAAGGKVEVPYLTAGYATHSSVLTGPQIEDSVRKNGFQNIALGSTVAYWAKNLVKNNAFRVSIGGSGDPYVGDSEWVTVDDATDTNYPTVAAELTDRYKVMTLDATNIVASSASVLTAKGSSPCGWHVVEDGVGDWGFDVRGSDAHAGAETIVLTPTFLYVEDPTWPPTDGPDGTPYA